MRKILLTEQGYLMLVKSFTEDDEFKPLKGENNDRLKND